MTPEEFINAGERLYGKRWKTPLARALKIDVSMVWRYATGQVKVPGPVEAALLCFIRELNHRQSES